MPEQKTTVKRRKRKVVPKDRTTTTAPKTQELDLKGTSTNPADTRAGKVGHGCIFGPPKSGKTGAACGPNTLLISWDPDGPSTEILKDRDDVYVQEPRTFEEAEAIVRALVNGQSKDFDYVVFDSVTYAFEVLGGKDILDTYIEGRDIRRPYGRAGALINSLILDLTSLRDVSVIFTAHLQKDDGKGDDGLVSIDTELGESEVKLAVTNMVWKALGGAVSWIGRTYKDEERVKDPQTKKVSKQTVYRMSFNDGTRSPAGSRFTMAGVYVIERDGEPVLQQIERDIEEGK